MRRKQRAECSRHRKPTIEALRALLIFSETGAVSEAARILGVTQPVVTKKLQIFKDPEACGAVLLRSSGRVTLTESAKAVIPAISELIDRYDRVIRYLHGEETAPQVIRIGTGGFAAEHYVPKALAALRRITDISGECQVESRVCRGSDRIRGTATGLFDLSIVTHDEVQVQQILREEHLDEAALTITPLVRHTVCLLAAPKTDAGRELARLPAGRAVPVARLKRWALVGPDSQSGVRRQLESRFPRGQLYFVAEGGGWPAAKEYAREGLGVAILPLATVSAADRRELVCRKLSKEFAIRDYLLECQASSHRLLQHLRNAIIETARNVSAAS